jgi:hypothetical protein
MGDTKRAREDLSSRQWCVGVPYQSSRPLTDDEVSQIKTRLYKYEEPFKMGRFVLPALGILLFFFPTGLPGILIVTALTGWSISCIRVAYPYLLLRKMLASGKVDIFAGKIRTTQQDKDQKHFLDTFLLFNSNKVNLEIVSGTRVLWSVNGNPVIRKRLYRVPIYILRHFQLGASAVANTQLLSQEKLELRERLGDYKKQNWIDVGSLGFKTVIIALMLLPNQSASCRFSGWFLLVMTLLEYLVVLLEAIPYAKTKRLIREDINRGELIWEESSQSTTLASSHLLWTVDGLPAPWRLSHEYRSKPPEPVTFFAIKTLKTEA